MTIKAQNLLRSFLLIPYIIWGIALLITGLFSAWAANSGAQNAFLNGLGGIAAFFAIAILGWGIPYTLLALGLFLWSLKKPASKIYRAMLLSPLFLAILVTIEMMLISFLPTESMPAPSLLQVLSYVLFGVVLSLVIGYAFVGVGALIYKAMQRGNLIRTEPEPLPA